MTLIKFLSLAPIALIFVTSCATVKKKEKKELELEAENTITLDEITSTFTMNSGNQNKPLTPDQNKLKRCIAFVKTVGKAHAELLQYLDPNKVEDNIPYKLANLDVTHCSGPFYKKVVKLTRAMFNRKPSKVGIILPMTGKHAPYSRSIVEGFLAAARHKSETFQNTFIVKDSLHSKEELLRAVAELIFVDQVSLIIGGVKKSEAKILVNVSKSLQMPTFILNKDHSLVAESQLAFQIHPNKSDLAKALVKAAKNNNMTKIAILRPDSQRSDQICDAFVKHAQAEGISITNNVTYTSGNFDSMNQAIEVITQTSKEGREEEYARIYREAKIKAKRSGHAFNPRSVVLPANMTHDATFIPDHYRIIRHFIKLLRYHGVKKHTLLGNHEWRSHDLLDPWDAFLEGSIFADFIGSYAKLPISIEFAPDQNDYFVAPSKMIEVDLKLVGYRAGSIALDVIKTSFLKQKFFLRQLKNVSEDGPFFTSEKAFYDNRSSYWPTYIFKIQKQGISLSNKLIHRHYSPKSSIY